MELFNHGKVVTKRDIIFMEEQFSWGYFNNCPPPPPILKSGTVSVITAYLPEMGKFAISIENGALLTFSMTEEEFEHLFYIDTSEKGMLNGD